jgi:hypothetical protein
MNWEEIDCRKCEDLLSVYEWLDESEKMAVDSHIEACPGCRATFETMLLLGDVLSGKTEEKEAMFPDLSNQVMSEIAKEERHDLSLRLIGFLVIFIVLEFLAIYVSEATFAHYLSKSMDVYEIGAGKFADMFEELFVSFVGVWEGAASLGGRYFFVSSYWYFVIGIISILVIMNRSTVKEK